MQQTQGPQPAVTFFAREVPDPGHSKEAGYPRFVGQDYIRIELPGEKDVRIFPASDEYKRRYPDQWSAYAEKRKPTPPGMPTAILFPQFPEIVATLEFFNIRTVEQLANISDTAKGNIGLGADEWQRKANEFLSAAAGTKSFHKISAELEMANLTIGKLTAENAALRGKVAEQEAALGRAGSTSPQPDALAALQRQIDEMKAHQAPQERRPNKETK